MEFKSFSEIKKYTPLRLTITQKIHGTNAQIAIYLDDEGQIQLKTGSRTRWIFPHDDNYGFATFVHAHKQEFIDKLGLGTHHGEWAGPGINSGEGLKEKTFVLFNHGRPYEKGLPPSTVLVPVLYDGLIPEGISIDQAVEAAMNALKQTGSCLAPGFMRPEGVVIDIGGQRRKKVFKAEETQWKEGSKVKDPNKVKVTVNCEHLFQPIRLEKLISRDENYIKNYPQSLSLIVKDYVADLEKEGQLPTDPDECKAMKKAAGGPIFKFVKTCMDEVEQNGEISSFL